MVGTAGGQLVGYDFLPLPARPWASMTGTSLCLAQRCTALQRPLPCLSTSLPSHSLNFPRSQCECVRSSGGGIRLGVSVDRSHQHPHLQRPTGDMPTPSVGCDDPERLQHEH